MEEEVFRTELHFYDDISDEIVVVTSAASREDVKEIIKAVKKTNWKALICIIVYDDVNNKHHIWNRYDGEWRSYDGTETLRISRTRQYTRNDGKLVPIK